MTLAAAGAHAALMDQVYRRQRHIYDLSRKFFLFGRDRLIRRLALRPGESLVEIGCGTGRNLIAIGRRFPDANLYGLDASRDMLATARGQLRRAGMAERVRLVHGLAEELSPAAFGLSSFDHALFSYSLSMIPDWQRALAAASGALSAQGLVHIVDFGDFGTLVGAGLLKTWLGLFHVIPRGEFLVELERRFAGAGLETLPGRYAFFLSLSKSNGGTLPCCRRVTAGQ